MIARWALNFTLIVVLAGVGVWQYSRTNQAEQALCALRTDLEVRVDSSRKYLRDLDAGKRDPIPGISRVDIVTGIRNQERTIGALQVLDCN